MKEHRRSTWMLVLMSLAIITGVHLLYRARRYVRRPGPLLVSDLTPGATLPTFHLMGAESSDTSLPSTMGCWTLVVFSPECPHCRVAAERDAAQPSEERYPVIWVGEGSRPSIDSFADSLSRSLSFFSSTDVRARLHVRAVPTAILVGSNSQVLLTFPYQGGVSKKQLQGFCAPGSV